MGLTEKDIGKRVRHECGIVGVLASGHVFGLHVLSLQGPGLPDWDEGTNWASDVADGWTLDENVASEASPSPPLPPGSRGVILRMLSTDPPVALLEFEPGGVLGVLGVHPEHDEIVTVLRGSLPGNIARDRIPAGVRHALRAGAEGALVLVAMVPRDGLQPAAEPDTIDAVRHDIAAELQRRDDRIDALEERIHAGVPRTREDWIAVAAQGPTAGYLPYVDGKAPTADAIAAHIVRHGEALHRAAAGGSGGGSGWTQRDLPPVDELRALAAAELRAAGLHAAAVSVADGLSGADAMLLLDEPEGAAYEVLQRLAAAEKAAAVLPKGGAR